MNRASTGLFIMLFATCNLLASEKSDMILKEYGRTKGFCLVLGANKMDATSPVPIQIAKKTDMLIHAIVTNQEALKNIKKLTRANKLIGQLRSDTASLNQLPFVNDIVNLLIIDDESLPIQESEIQRIVAPGGVICRWDGVKYIFKTNPRPGDMGTWLHTAGDPGWNRKGDDKLAPLKPEIRWQDGIPISFNAWASCRAYVVTERHCFALSSIELENLNENTPSRSKHELYLSARDAFSGLPLWKINCNYTDDGSALTPRNSLPLVANSEYVYSYRDGEIFGANAKTGEIEQNYPVAYPTTRLLIKDDVLISSGTKSKVAYGLWHPWVSPSNDGKLEVFDIVKGVKLWEVEGACQDVVVEKDKVFVLMHYWPNSKGSTKFPPKGKKIDPTLETIAKVTAYHIKTGELLWESVDPSFVNERAPTITCAGAGVVVVSRVFENKGFSVLSSDSGKLLWSEDVERVSGKALCISIVDDELWYKNEARDPKTGKHIGDVPVIRNGMCTPPAILDHLVILGRRVTITPRIDPVTKKDVQSVGAIRGACIQGFAPANGMFYTGQNRCKCNAQCLPGFIAMGAAPTPKQEDFKKPRPIVKGEAYNNVKKTELEEDAFSILMGSNERNNHTKAPLPKSLHILWESSVVKKSSSPLADVWKARGRNIISAPTTGYGKIFTTAIDSGVVTALNAETGKEEWSFVAEGRVDMPPTLGNGMAVFGCRNGWVYALRASDGVLAWKTRIGPMDLRMVAFGQIESLWPVPGSVLLNDGVIYTSAGKTSENNGGLIVMALDAKTGEQKWTRIIGSPFLRQNDILSYKNNSVFIRHMKMNPNDGSGEIPVSTKENKSSLAGLADGVWTHQTSRRSGKIKRGNISMEMLAWNNETTFGITDKYGKLKCVAINTDKTNAKKIKTDDYLWEVLPAKGALYEAMLLSDDTLALGGRIYQEDKLKGYIELLDTATGKSKNKLTLKSFPVFQGIATLNGKLYLSMNDGSVVCVGDE